MWCAVGTVFALGLCGGCKGGETPLRGGGRELSGESMACQTEREGGRKGQRSKVGGRGEQQEKVMDQINRRTHMITTIYLQWNLP